MEHKGLSLHETMKIHEMLNFKTVCMAQSKLLQGIVFDQDLKILMEEDVQQSIKAVGTLQALLKGNNTTLQ